ncbi:hypothetical protein PoB_004039700 [Plakobranchus ocellatus]|uniref:Uncharacterized protein n=1 Tax=Plakobranchus ocellatus TaxID=259542 RepID=A0AAV4B429_9GAST|nr:hypothetical protein PoB_004039700 [Plakobranchus ocellatus]
MLSSSSSRNYNINAASTQPLPSSSRTTKHDLYAGLHQQEYESSSTCQPLPPSFSHPNPLPYVSQGSYHLMPYGDNREAPTHQPEYHQSTHSTPQNSRQSSPPGSRSRNSYYGRDSYDDRTNNNRNSYQQDHYYNNTNSHADRSYNTTTSYYGRSSLRPDNVTIDIEHSYTHTTPGSYWL